MVILESQNGDVYTYKGLGVDTNKRLVFDTWNCIQCGLCVDQCLSNAFLLDEEALIFEPNSCDMRGSCAEACPMNALVFTDTGNEDQECTIPADGQAIPCSEMLDITSPTGGSGNTFPRIYRWKIYKNLFNMWYYQSTETATIKQVMRNGQLENQYVDLTHSSVDLIGHMSFVTGQMSVTAAPTIGIYNSVMAITGVFSLHLVCKEVPSVISTSFSVHMAWTSDD